MSERHRQCLEEKRDRQTRWGREKEGEIVRGGGHRERERERERERGRERERERERGEKGVEKR